LTNALDPFHEDADKPYERCLRLLGADFRLRCNHETVLDLVDEAFAGLPEQFFPSSSPRIQIDIVCTKPVQKVDHSSVPRLQFLSGAGLIVASFDANNYAALSPAASSGLVGVSEDFLMHSHVLRYELIEFAVMTLAARCQNLIPLHAACFGKDGIGLLISGDSGTGKSTLSLACALRGVEYLSDDAVLVQSKTMLAAGCSNFLHIDSGSLRFVEDLHLARQFASSPEITRRSGARKHAIDVRNGQLATADHTLRISALILLSANPSTDGECLQRMNSQEALAEFSATQPYAARTDAWPEFLDELALVPAFRLNRPTHPDVAAIAIQDLLASLQA
jgi:hypothetical protein